MVSELLKRFMREERVLDPSRASTVQEQCQKFLANAEKRENICRYAYFSKDLVKKLEAAACMESASAHGLQRIWARFHQLRIGELHQLWSKICRCIDVVELDPLAIQYVNLKLFEPLVQDTFGSVAASQPAPPTSLTSEEENAMQYACGFIPHKLLKKYEKMDGTLAGQFVECLRNMAVVGQEESILDYTRQWMARINRGGLFPLNDLTHCFFIAIEAIVQAELAKSVLPSENSNLSESLQERVMKDCDVQYQWTLVRGYDFEGNEKLLLEIVKLWVTIRGFSLAASWMEEYQKANREAVRHARALRKDLKRKSSAAGQD